MCFEEYDFPNTPTSHDSFPMRNHRRFVAKLKALHDEQAQPSRQMKENGCWPRSLHFYYINIIIPSDGIFPPHYLSYHIIILLYLIIIQQHIFFYHQKFYYYYILLRWPDTSRHFEPKI